MFWKAAVAAALSSILTALLKSEKSDSGVSVLLRGLLCLSLLEAKNLYQMEMGKGFCPKRTWPVRAGVTEFHS